MTGRIAPQDGPPHRPVGPSFRHGPFRPLRFVYMEQEIQYLDFEGKRLAYSTYGEGPAIVVGPRWVSHLEEEWEDADQRPFYAELARTYRVVRFDRIGCGLSARELDPRPTIESESRQLEAGVDAGGGPAGGGAGARESPPRGPGRGGRAASWGG